MDLIELQDKAAICEECELYKTRKVPVFAKGNPEANIMIVGMCPGPDENSLDNEMGWPFVGKAGNLLDKILKDVSLGYKDVYITNIVKCFLSPGIRLENIWIDRCMAYLIGQITYIEPKIVLTLGADASRALLNKSISTSMGSMRKKRYKFTDNISIITTYHPSYLLRGGGKKHKDYEKVLKDFNWVKEIINR
jgi:DNA polymerase